MILSNHFLLKTYSLLTQINLTFENIDRLKAEKEILITKAISWLLREMIPNHKRAVADYLKKNENSLPKIAVRETKRKIQTGRK